MDEKYSGSEQEMLAASKSLSRIDIKIDDETMHLESAWCRVVYSNFESLVSPRRCHTFYELHYVMRGEVDFKVNDNEVILHDGEFLIIPPLVYHSSERAAADTAKFVFGFSMTTEKPHLAEALKATQNISVLRETEDIRTLVGMMLRIAAERGPDSTTAVSRLCECLVLGFLSGLCPKKATRQIQTSNFETDIRVEKVKTYIKENIMANINYADVAQHLYLSARQTNRIVKAQTGYTVEQLINIERIKYIKKLLRSDFSLSDIAEATGFSTEYALNRFFKRMEKTTLGAWRRDIKK